MSLAALLDPGPAAGLGALFVSAFLAATVLPGGSELVLAGFVVLHPDAWPAALALATVGNTLGGMSTYLLARLVPRKEVPPRLAWLRRYGSAALLLSWVPVIGDALCAAAGVLRLRWPACALWMATGKLGRYLVVAWVALAAGAG